MEVKEYQKIPTLYERQETTKKIIEGKYSNPDIQYLSRNLWQFDEKIDGTNIRVIWDGHSVSFRGRTDKATIPDRLMKSLEAIFSGDAMEQMFEQKFGEKKVILYGQGYGGKIQKGGNYRPDESFILFDVEIGGTILERDSMMEIADYFGIDYVPTVLIGTIQDAADYVKLKPTSRIGLCQMEGLVGRPMRELKDRRGNRIIVKVKVSTFEEIERQK